MKRVLFLLIPLILCGSLAFAQTSGRQNQPGWTPSHELMYQQQESIREQRLHKMARKEFKQGYYGPGQQQLNNKYSAKWLRDIHKR